jgi:tetratricopeptide (TPR) repeat protein
MTDAEELIKKGEDLYNQGNYFEARAVFCEICMDSDAAYPLYMLGYSLAGIVMTYLEEGDYDRVLYCCNEAIETFEKVLSKPISDKMRQNSSNTLEKLKATQKDVKHAKESIEERMKEFSEKDYME